MTFTMSFFIPPAKVTFEAALALQNFAGVMGLDLNFDGFSGNIHFPSVPSPKEFAVLTELAAYDARPTYLGMEGVSDFRKYFGKTASMDLVAAKVYCQMCEEGKIW